MKPIATAVLAFTVAALAASVEAALGGVNGNGLSGSHPDATDEAAE